ncbi:MAG: hypothetical protein AB1394_03510 [Bacteroidota bacterium]
MKNLIGFLFFLVGLGSINAQSFNKIYHALPNQVQKYSSSDTLKILAVMVEFQEDKYDATIGTGKFGSHYTKTYGDTILDPLPHNAEYFSDHLMFAKNYFGKVSKGRLNINYQVLPQVITVSKTMREYVPGYKSKDLTPLGKFSQEVWNLADQKFSNVKFADYNLFIIFHAGVSSGLDLGSFSIDRNMPSLYLSNASLKTIFGNNFTGFSTKSGSITNSIIMPETESREQTFIDNSVGLVQVTINGGLVANIGSHLGLPDLFDTETGKSAIGRFGLMDGQAIVANYGMFPPELSPWEKIYLGWEQPKEISIKGGKVNIVTSHSASLTDTTLLKIPISSKEYFLIENRQQDAKNDGLILTIKKENQIFKKTIQKDTSGLFNLQPTDIKGGVVIDVDEFDAAVPGNGIIIWHIDENIIDAKIAENKINSDLKKKGVDVEEADGIQDIGETFTSPYGAFIGEGDKYDFWHKGNKAKLYKNSFSPVSKPNSSYNSGSNSLVTIDSFSDNNNKMNLNVSYGNDQQKLIANFDLPFIIPGAYQDMLMLKGANGIDYFVLLHNSLKKYTSEGKLLFSSDNFSMKGNFVGVTFNNKQYVASVYQNYLNIYSKDLASSNSINKTASINASVSSNLVLSKKNNLLFISFGISGGKFVETDIDKLILTGKIPAEDIKAISTVDISRVNRPFDNADGYYSVIAGNEIIDSKGNKTAGKISGQFQHILVKDAKGDYTNIAFHANAGGTKSVSVIKNNKLEGYLELPNVTTKITFAAADLFGDGQMYLLTVNQNELLVYTLNGVLSENFPFSVKDRKLLGTPLAADINKDGVQEIIVVTNAAEIYAVNPSTGKVLSGYPIGSGIYPNVNLVLYSEELPTMGPLPTFKPYAGIIDKNGHVGTWSLSPVQGKVNWAAKYGTTSGNAYLELSNFYKPSSDFFPTAKAYNWPNPVYGSSTKIRYYVSENSTATVKIFDLAGGLVTTLSGKAIGGMDNEIEWEVSKIQSGVYYANLEVIGSGGKSANKIIKIAVIK